MRAASGFVGCRRRELRRLRPGWLLHRWLLSLRSLLRRLNLTCVLAGVIAVTERLRLSLENAHRLAKRARRIWQLTRAEQHNEHRSQDQQMPRAQCIETHIGPLQQGFGVKTRRNRGLPRVLAPIVRAASKQLTPSRSGNQRPTRAAVKPGVTTPRNLPPRLPRRRHTGQARPQPADEPPRRGPRARPGGPGPRGARPTAAPNGGPVYAKQRA